MTNSILQMLIAERDKLNRAIAALETEPKRRGRPPGGGQRRGPGRPPGRRKKRGGMSAEARKAQSERMRAYWAAKRRQKARAGG